MSNGRKLIEKSIIFFFFGNLTLNSHIKPISTKCRDYKTFDIYFIANLLEEIIVILQYINKINYVTEIDKFLSKIKNNNIINYTDER